MQMASREQAAVVGNRVAESFVTFVNTIAFIEDCTRENILALLIGNIAMLVASDPHREHAAALYRAAADLLEGKGDRDACIKLMEEAALAYAMAHFPTEGVSN